MHLTTDEIELWSLGLLGAQRAFHLSDCSLCRDIADRARGYQDNLASGRVMDLQVAVTEIRQAGLARDGG